MTGSNSNFLARDHVRIVLIKESEIKGRQLLFDSSYKQNFLFNEENFPTNNQDNYNSKDIYLELQKRIEEFFEISNMAFGSIPTRDPNNYFKIHNLSCPERIAFTQVFSMPHGKFKLGIQHLNNNSRRYRLANSDSLCNKHKYFESNDLNTALENSECHILRTSLNNSSSLSILDSGYLEEPESNISRDNTFSSRSFAQFSRENSSISGEMRGTDSAINMNSMPDCHFRQCTRSLDLKHNKHLHLGLVVIVALTFGKGKYLMFYNKHFEIVELIMKNLRKNVEVAISRPEDLLVIMFEITDESANWLIRLVTDLNFFNFKSKFQLCKSHKYNSFFNISSLVDYTWKKLKYRINRMFGTGNYKSYFKEFCQILEDVDVKDKNLVNMNKFRSITPFKFTLIRMGKFIPNMIMQGMRLSNAEGNSILDVGIILKDNTHEICYYQELISIIANTERWNVEVVSRHSYFSNRNRSKENLSISSQLVLCILQVVTKLWKIQLPENYCTTHIENRLQEMCIRSSALAHLLLGVDYCTMQLLTSTFNLDADDIALLMSIASILVPQATRKYGVSLQ